jgi:hypothetical protein
MATMSNQQGSNQQGMNQQGMNQQGMNQQGQQGMNQQGMNQQSDFEGTRIGSPISNEAYNVVAALHAKLEGLEAYRKYARDPNRQIWEELTQTEIRGVGVLVQELERLVREGKFRGQQSG